MLEQLAVYVEICRLLQPPKEPKFHYQVLSIYCLSLGEPKIAE